MPREEARLLSQQAVSTRGFQYNACREGGLPGLQKSEQGGCLMAVKMQVTVGKREAPVVVVQDAGGVCQVVGIRGGAGSAAEREKGRALSYWAADAGGSGFNSWSESRDWRYLPK